MMVTALLALTLTAEPNLVPPNSFWGLTPSATFGVATADETRNWMLGGAAAWAPIGALAGVLMGALVELLAVVVTGGVAVYMAR